MNLTDREGFRRPFPRRGRQAVEPRGRKESHYRAPRFPILESRIVAQIRCDWSPVRIAELAMLDDDPEGFADQAIVFAAVTLLRAGASDETMERHTLAIVDAFQSHAAWYQWGNA